LRHDDYAYGDPGYEILSEITPGVPLQRAE
jgi:hypothetical protein